MCNCNQTNPCNQNQNICGQTPCTPTQDCSCPTRLNTECLTYNGLDLECSGIESGLDLNQTLQLLDTYICDAIAEINNSINLINVGAGLQIYAGIDAIGRRKIRTLITTGDLLTSVQNENDITFGIDETELSQFVKDNQKTYSVANVGTGAEIYKDSTVVGDNTQFNFKSVIIDEQNGMGESFVRGIVENTDDITVQVKKIKSDTLTISANDEEISLDLAESAQIPALYVNNLYVPSYKEWLNENKIQNSGTAVNGFVFRGKGTLAQPFTDSTVYPLAGGSPTITPNTAIQNALDGDSAYNTPYSFIGMGSDVAPQKAGQQIKVQYNIAGYNFTGNINLNQVNIILEENVVIYSNPSIGDFLVDYDTLPPTQALSMSINLKEGAKIVLAKSGFRNSGTSTATSNFSNHKQISISGNGIIFQNSNSIIANDYVIIESNYTTTNTFNNDATIQFIIDKTILSTNTQSIYKVGGNSRVNFSDVTLLINGITGLPVSTEIFNQIGGIIKMNNLNIAVTPFFGTILNKVFPISKSATIPSELNMSNITLSGGMTTIIENESALQPNVSVTNLTTIDFQCSNIVKSPSVLWTNCFLHNNVITSGVVDFTQVDLTLNNVVSCVNSFSGNVVESLRVFQNKNSAIVAGALLNSAFIKRTVYNATDLVAGVEYKVVTSGSPSLGAVGSFFTATGSETGTGTASLETREILT